MREGLMVPTEEARYAYVIRYYGHLMTRQERLAYKNLILTAKRMEGRTDADAQIEARKLLEHPARPEAHKLSDDPEAWRLASGGLRAFVARTAQRILDERRAEVRFNYCCRCGALARTPKARQCRFCRHDWHKEITNSE